MQFLHKRMFLREGQRVRVTLNRPANVKFMSDSNFSNYRNGRKHSYFYGQVINNTVIIPASSTGMWNITIDLGLAGGSIRHSIEII
ncbi:DUF1883 domain-containing protein [Lysinibacillus sp. 2017]|uniref:DUF1883 domain-containing protein n=1 Tax=unclassified Lysinibacillus TaxID=2636778 RepID=UPI000D52605B|nr:MULTISPECIES: DUF1883 domain-containing protein [unclassified Lysinibacillus]AWE08884.1 DUF1883 domain-containing protein [Lysinibacillus sp. 2017]TGN34732.1 DUF1883 domain-containing protein [Lysinibacillus sp. S2017]